MLADLEVGALSRVLRPTMLTAIALGVVGFVVAALLSAPLAAVGIAVGIALAILNLRLLAAGVVKVAIDHPDGGGDTKSGSKVVKRILRTRSLLRLSLLTAIVIVAMVVKASLGLGLVIGLVIFQLAFVVNAGRAVLREGIS
jgi:hypothetical protein